VNDLSPKPAWAASIHPARETRSFWVMGDRVALRARLPGPNLWVVDVEVPPGSGVPPHSHASPEVFIVQDGVVRFWTNVGGVPQEVDAGPGDVLTVPAHAPHGYRNASGAAARFTGLVDDSMAAFFEAAARDVPPPPGPPPAEEIGRIMALAARSGITMLGQEGNGA
jgi:quercetin dioxygenase-like cupin family protein